MGKRSKILAIALVASVMGTGTPVGASHGAPMFNYYHYGDGGLVGRARDECGSSGVVTVWLWGYGTNNIDAIQWAECYNGQAVPID